MPVTKIAPYLLRNFQIAMNEEHQEEEFTEVEALTDEPHDGEDRDDTPQPESTLLTRRATEDGETTDATEK
ncbi:MAG: hypothetical protein HOB73_11840, partial [Planctomycetaceae bacterium]|nr:hypothetical protein [Planctomycetaceae bacterium]